MALRAHSAETRNNIESLLNLHFHRQIQKRPAREPHAPAIPNLPHYCCVGWIGSIGAPPSFSKAFADKRTRPFSSV
ncbi:MAG: hypothetical protein JWR14_7731 [Caballeronia sp.]|jgi:hypothetical protein|nr:hypothetical protein [Caballeronia sp.]